jgi:hypothetical protein
MSVGSISLRRGCKAENREVVLAETTADPFKLSAYRPRGYLP